MSTRPTGGLRWVLWRLLTAANVTDAYVWTRDTLERGATVSVTRLDDGRRLVVISRPREVEPRYRKAWLLELETFVAHLPQGTEWEPTETVPESLFNSPVPVTTWAAFAEKAARANATGTSTDPGP